MLLQYCKVNRKAPLYMVLWQLGFFVFGVAMVLIINRFVNDDKDFACMGALFALIATLVGCLARGNTTLGTRFNMAVSMGQTRRFFLLWDTAISLLVCLLGMAVAWGLYRLELLLYGALYPGFENGIPLDVVCQWKILLPAALVLSVASLVFGAVQQRFGLKAFGTVWLVFCFSFMVLPRAINAALEGGTSLLARLGGGVLWLVNALPPAVWAGLGGAVLLVLTVWSFCYFWRAAVKL